MLVHGTGAHKKWWYPVGPKLNNKAHVIAIDLPGMGDSDFREKYKVEDFGSCVTNVIKAEKDIHNINYVYLVGSLSPGVVTLLVMLALKRKIS